MNFARKTGAPDPTEVHFPSGTVLTFTGTTAQNVATQTDIDWAQGHPLIEPSGTGGTVTPPPVDEYIFLRDGVVVKRNPTGSGTVPVTLNGSAALGSPNNPVTDPNAARPAGLPSVWWRSTTQPTNLADNDVWIAA